MPYANISRRPFVRHDMIAVLVGFLSAFAALGLWWQFQTAQNEVRANMIEQTEKRATQLADAVSDQIDLLLGNTDFALRELRDAWLSDSGDFEATVRSIEATFPDLSLVHVAVIGPDGYVAFSTRGVKQRVYAGDREHFRIHAEGKGDVLHVSKPIFGRVSGDWNILISRPILRHGTFAGVMIIGLSPGYLSAQLAKVSMSRGDVVVLLHNDGAFLARNIDWEKALGKSVKPDRPFLAKDAPISGVFQAPASLDQVPRIFGWHKLRQNGLILVVGLDQNVLLAPFEQQYAQGRLRNAAFIVLILLLGGGISLLLYHQARQQDALRKSRETLTEAQRIAKLGNWELNLRDNRLVWSDEVYRIFEIDAENSDTTYDAFLAAIHPADRDAVDAAFKHSLTTRAPYAITHRLIMPDGRIKHVHEQGETRFDATGKPLRSLGTIQDITARKLVEDALAESEERFKLFMDTLPAAVFIKDAESTTLYCNRYMAEIIGAKNWLGKTVRDLFPPEVAAKMIADDRHTLDAGYVVTEEYVPGADGRTRLYETHKFVLPTRGENPLIGGIALDITDRKAAELELQIHQNHLEALVEERTADLTVAKNAAEEASRAKSTFLANMSHELRTPMNAIMGMTDLALRHANEPKLRDQLAKIEQASRHLLAVINDILDISKIEADRLTLERVGFKLGAVLENLVSLIGHKAADQGLALAAELAPELADRSFLGDPLRLGQVLLNLAGNALKFTERGSIALRCTLAEESPDDVLLRFEVQDTGIGIAPGDQARLFDAFEQADGSMTRKYGGTGLGLAISKRLVHLMGGEIGVESRSGAGSTFWFTARLGKAVDTEVVPAQSANADTAEAQLKARHAGARILLAEDEPINQEVSRGLLEDVGLQVDLAEDGRQAVAKAAAQHYDLIIMDMQMPHMNGIDATQAIRALPGHATTPILAMTANAFDEDRQRCLAAGMNAHIGKPVQPDVLFDTLLAWLPKPMSND